MRRLSPSASSRAEKLTGLRMKDLDLDTTRLFVRRRKGSLSTHHAASWT
jgi:hypothetical protein